MESSGKTRIIPHECRIHESGSKPSSFKVFWTAERSVCSSDSSEACSNVELPLRHSQFEAANLPCRHPNDLYAIRTHTYSVGSFYDLIQKDESLQGAVSALYPLSVLRQMRGQLRPAGAARGQSRLIRLVEMEVNEGL